MNIKDAKVRIAIGEIEVDYEGDPTFLRDGLKDLVESISSISQSLPKAPAAMQTAENTVKSPQAQNDSNHLNLALSTRSIAARLDAKTGPELAICAMANLELVQGQASYERKSILEEMKTATGYYNNNMGKNNAANITSLVKTKRVTEVGAGKYCLSATERKKVETSIAEGE